MNSLQDERILLARSGDRVVLPVRIGEDSQVDAIVTPLRNQGIEVELRYESNPRFQMKGGLKSQTNDSLTVSIVSEFGYNLNIRCFSLYNILLLIY